jgi:hypothetical protein
MGWNRLGSVEPQDLKQARLNLHFAAQVVSGVGRTLLARQDDDSHTSLSWCESVGGLIGQPILGPRPFRAALDFERFRLLMVDLDGNVLFESAFAGKTVDQAYSWLAGAITSRLGKGFDGFNPLHYDMPAHPGGDSATFSFEPAAPFAELKRWYANAAATFEQLRRNHGSGTIRCWPHHFDIATLIELGGGKTIGLGLSPGDASYEEPYWYVGPWPHPRTDAWPPIAGRGRWHTDGFVAAILTAGDFVGENDQPKRLREFFASAIEGSQALLLATA